MNMVNRIREDDEEKPLDPAVEEVRRKVVRFVAINLVFLICALMAVAAAIVYKWRAPAGPATMPAASLTAPADGGVIEGIVELPIGSKIVSQSLSGDRVSIFVEEANGAKSLHIYDLTARRIIGRYVLAGTN